MNPIKLTGRLLFAVLMLLGFNSLAQTTVRFNFTNPQFGVNQCTNRLVILQAETGPTLYSGNQVLPWQIRAYTDTNGVVTFTNLAGAPTSGYYHWTVPAPPQTAQGDIWVQATNLGVLDASTIQVIMGASTFPQSSFAWSAGTSDLRYQLNGTTLSNTFYPLFSNPSNYVQNATLLAASNAIVSATPNTNGFATTNYVGQFYYPTSNPSGFISSNSIPVVFGSYLTNGQTGNVIVATNGTLGTSNLIANGRLSVTGTSALSTVTASSIGASAGTLNINLSAGTLTSGANTVNTSGFTTAGGQLAPSGFIGNGGQLTNINAGSITGLLSAVNIPDFVVTNGTLLMASNFLATNGLGLLVQTNNQLVALSSNLFNINSNAIAALSGSLSSGKQPASSVLTNLSVTGAYTNILASGIGSFLTTNIAGNTTFINVSNQIQLTNGFTPLVFTNPAWVVYTNQLNALTNGFISLGILNTTSNSIVTNLQAQINSGGSNNLAVTTNLVFTRQLGSSILTNLSGLNSTNQIVYTNDQTWFDAKNAAFNATNSGGIVFFTNLMVATNAIVPPILSLISNNMVITTNLFNTTTNFAQTNWQSGFVFATNYANTNTSSQFSFATNYAATNVSGVYLARSNGMAVSLYVTNNLMLGLRTNIFLSTNLLAVIGGGTASGTYEWVFGSQTWTNVFQPPLFIQPSGGNFFLMSNAVTLYSWASMNIQGVVVSGPAPAPYLFSDGYLNCDGLKFNGWIYATNLTSQITNGASGGVVQGPLANEAFSTTGTNVIVNLIGQFGVNPTNGVSPVQATNIALSIAGMATNGLGTMAFQNTNQGWMNTNGVTAFGQSPFSTNGPFGFIWTNLPSGGGSSTNGLASIQFTTNLVAVTSNALQGAISAGGIATLNGFGTNTTITNGIVLSSTNISVLGGGNGAGGTGSGIIAFPHGDTIREYSSGSAASGDTGITMGISNSASLFENFTFISGAFNDVAANLSGPVTGGTIMGAHNTIGSVSSFPNNGSFSTIAGGLWNASSGPYGFVAAGLSNNIAPGQSGSFAAGVASLVNNSGTFVWNDWTSDAATTPFSSVQTNTFIIHSFNGVAINTNNPSGNALEVFGNVDAQSYTGLNMYPTNVSAANAINAAYFSINGVPAGFTTNTPQQLTYFATNGVNLATNFNGIYFFSNTIIASSQTVNVYTNTKASSDGQKYTLYNGTSYSFFATNTVSSINLGFYQYGPSAVIGTYPNHDRLNWPTNAIVVTLFSNGVPTVVIPPQMVFAGTNNPNGVQTANYGAIYNQFSPINTNQFITQWINTNNAAGWQ